MRKMSKKFDGGPAFPCEVRELSNIGDGRREVMVDKNKPGMSLRDYFAAKAMQGIVAGVSGLSEDDEMRVREQWKRNYPGSTWGGAAAEQAYHIADEMLKAREQ